MMNFTTISLIIIESTLFIFLSIAFIIAIKILRFWDYNSTQLKQYQLQKKVYLSSVIISFVITLKIPLIFMLLYTLDDLSTLITGAMCSIGVLENADFGFILLFLKIITLIYSALWLLLFFKNQNNKTLTYTLSLYKNYIFLYILFLLEFILFIMMIFSINVDKIVSCCSTIFSNNLVEDSSQVLLFMDNTYVITAFILSFLSTFIKHKYFSFFFGILFFILSLIAITTFFSPYIYELPTHKCPFCVLQQEYFYIGYLLYSLLMLSLFSSSANIFLYLNTKRLTAKYYNLTRIFNTLLLCILCFYILKYYYINGVLL